MRLLKTGIPGLDTVLGGGVREKSAILLSGAPGVGKTLASLHFLLSGVKSGEPGLLITTEDSLEDLILYAQGISIDLSKYLNKSIFLIEKPVQELKGGIMSLSGLHDLIRKNGIKRIVVDSLVFFEYLYTESDVDDIEFRRRMLIFIHNMKKEGVTLWATSERSVTDVDRLVYDMMDFLFDGFFLMTRNRQGCSFETIFSVIKMKGQQHRKDIYPVMITKKGLDLLIDERPCSLSDSPSTRKK